MNSKKTKVSIIGAGAVGSSIAFDLSIQNICDEIVLIDRNKEKANAEAMDIQQGTAFQSRDIKISVGEYEDCGDADIVVITAAAPYVTGQRRLDMIDGAAEIMRTVVPSIMSSGFNGIMIVVTNPVDIMAYLAYKLSGLPKNQVFGTGTSLDSGRLRGLIANMLSIGTRSVQAFTMGEHGDSQFIPWSHVTVGGKKFTDIISDRKGQFALVNYDEVLNEIKEAAFKIGRIKRTTNYAIAASVANIVKVILNDESMVVPISTLLTGEYGVKDVFAGVTAILGSEGVKQVLELHLTENEANCFKKSITVIKEYSNRLNIES